MKTLSLLCDLEGIDLEDIDKDKSPQEIAVLVIKNIVITYANRLGATGRPTGLKEDERRKYYKLFDRLEKAVKEEAELVELEDDWMGFLRKCKREALFTPNDLSKRIEQLIDDVRDR